ncbi:MAG TPA: catalase [Nocardioides sp.]|uniref:catalase n=1 Tax=Nocardioides sp. TaxID=35761 RepID=UPI002E32F3F9|nr:catalase [Nocardioides sp.]HEX3929883.1 catalase [Nocardioides sp.]
MSAKESARSAAPMEDQVPGAPASSAPTYDEPTDPAPPPERKPDQTEPPLRTAAGASAQDGTRAQRGEYLTTATGTRLHDTDHSLKAGSRGPTLLQDHHLREKITHFDHERIPERVVHARGAAAHGRFVGYGTADDVCEAGFLAADAETPVFVRFSTVLGSRGSADTVRDTRGFATKFYTDEGVFDLVGNNIPVFFIQDGIKFPDVVHAAKPHPDREIPQAQSAHDTFWDFVSLHTEAQHHTLWNMSDRGIPRSYRMMEGFGVHTFRLTSANGTTQLAKFHWKPVLGVHSLTWEEAQRLAGADPDYHRRDLYDAIEAGAYPEWELGLQVFEDAEDQMFQGIDLLDATKMVPEELAPVQPVGRLTLDRNVTNYFAETEQVAFHVGHLVPGIDVTDDPLLQARLFSYVDTQLTRLGGPNFDQIPINRSHCPVNDMLRDGYHQHAVHTGVAPYHPNSLDGGNPFPAAADLRAFVEAPVTVAEGGKVRDQPASYDDHFSQVRLFWKSMSAVEQEHIIAAYTFELSKCFEQTIKERQLQALANVDARLCEEVATGLGLVAPAPETELTDETPSGALSQIGDTWPLAGRMVGIVVDADGDVASLPAIRSALLEAGTTPLVIAARGGELGDGVAVQRTFAAAQSAELDAVLLLGAPAPAPDALTARDTKAGADDDPMVDPRVALLLDETFRHAKPMGAVDQGMDVLAARGMRGLAGVAEGEAEAVVSEVLDLLGRHRVWERFAVDS